MCFFASLKSKWSSEEGIIWDDFLVRSNVGNGLSGSSARGAGAGGAEVVLVSFAGFVGLEVEVAERLSVLDGREEVDFVALRVDVRELAVRATEALVALVDGDMGVVGDGGDRSDEDGWMSCHFHSLTSSHSTDKPPRVIRHSSTPQPAASEAAHVWTWICGTDISESARRSPRSPHQGMLHFPSFQKD
jgi:hypothetical protein